jgi:hypothetical protein
MNLLYDRIRLGCVRTIDRIMARRIVETGGRAAASTRRTPCSCAYAGSLFMGVAHPALLGQFVGHGSTLARLIQADLRATARATSLDGMPQSPIGPNSISV